MHVRFGAAWPVTRPLAVWMEGHASGTGTDSDKLAKRIDSDRAQLPKEFS